jgi:hypothetical protein
MADEKNGTENKGNRADNLAKALRALKISSKRLLSYKEYSDRVVIVTTAGQKLVWNKG